MTFVTLVNHNVTVLVFLSLSQVLWHYDWSISPMSPNSMSLKCYSSLRTIIKLVYLFAIISSTFENMEHIKTFFIKCFKNILNINYKHVFKKMIFVYQIMLMWLVWVKSLTLNWRVITYNYINEKIHTYSPFKVLWEDMSCKLICIVYFIKKNKICIVFLSLTNILIYQMQTLISPNNNIKAWFHLVEIL